MVNHGADQIRRVSILISKYTDDYVVRLTEARSDGMLRMSEAELLGQLEASAAVVLDQFDRTVDAPAHPSIGDLMLTDFYDGLAALGPEGSRVGLERVPDLQRTHWRVLVGALLAAETETNGKFRQRRGQIDRLAEVLQAVGDGFRDFGLPLHAAAAYERAAEQHLLLGDRNSRDRCSLAATRARHEARDRGFRKLAEACANALVGYGYLPYRLLAWVLVQLAVFGFVLWLAEPRRVDVVEAYHMSLLDYLNPLGIGDVSQLTGVGQSLLVLESYAGTISTSVFFALLVRRWFNA